MNISMQNKVVLVTGGASGIGASIAEEFAKQGASVVIADISKACIDTINDLFDANNLPVTTIECDVTVSSNLKSLMSEIQSQFGKLDVLVNNVGDFLGKVKPFEKMTDDDIDELYSVNLRQLMLCSRDAIPLLKSAGAGSAIINISSIEGYRAMPNIAPYGAFKLGIEGFTKSLALELAPNGIRVNAIAPETTETEQVRPKEWIAKEDYERPNHWVPLGRFGVPADIAGCTLFLASELSAWVTGTVIHCDGGALAAAGWYRTPEGGWTNTPIVDRSGIPSMVLE